MGNDNEIALLRRQLKAAQDALRKSETRNRLLFEDLAQAVWETDSTGAVTADSPSWRAYTDQTEEEMLGYGWLDAVHPDDRAYAERQWQEAVAEERDADAEFRVSAPGGGWRWTNARAVPLRDERGEIVGWIGFNIDIDARKRVEEALRESEERFRTMADNAPVLIWETDQNGAISVNRHYTEFFGVSADQIVRMGWTNFLHPDDAQGYLDAYAEAYRQRAAYVHECRCLRADGQWRWLRSSGGPIAENRFVGCSLDVTDLINAQRTLRESEERQAFLLQLSDAVRPLADPADVQGETTRRLRDELHAGWCYYVDWDLGKSIGLVLRDSVRDGLPSLTGAHDVSDAPEFLQLLTVGEALTVDDYATYGQLPARIRQNFTALGFRSMMAAPLVKEGRLIATLLVGDTEIRAWSASEVSLLEEVAERTWATLERARAEAALRNSEQRFQEFASASAFGLWIRDAQTLAMKYTSPAIAGIYGVEPDALLGDVSVWTGLIHSDDRDVARQHLEQARQGETIVHEFRIRRTSDHAIRWIRNTDFPLYEGDQVRRIGGIAEDVTEAKTTRQELEHGAERLRNAVEVGQVGLWDWNIATEMAP